MFKMLPILSTSILIVCFAGGFLIDAVPVGYFYTFGSATADVKLVQFDDELPETRIALPTPLVFYDTEFTTVFVSWRCKHVGLFIVRELDVVQQELRDAVVMSDRENKAFNIK